MTSALIESALFVHTGVSSWQLLHIIQYIYMRKICPGRNMVLASFNRNDSILPL